MAIREIKIPSQWYNVGVGLNGGERRGVAVFALGVGPCGKTVVKLEMAIDIAGVTVYQVCSDTERKTFFYPTHTLTGRVEILEE